jgi:hypothetical protein
MNDLDITALIRTLSRPHPSGGVVIERAAILAAGADSPEIIDWILAHAGTPEVPQARSQGLHGSRITAGESPAPLAPTRFILPAGTLH